MFVTGAFFSVHGVSAQETGILDYQLLEAVPGSESSGDFSDYLQAIYRFALWAVGIAALFMLSIGGMMYLTSAGNTSQLGSAKKIIFDALLGLVLAIVSWLILYTINPQLVEANLDAFKYAPTSAVNGSTIPYPTGGSSVSTSVATSNPGTDCSSSDVQCKCAAAYVSEETRAVLDCMASKGDLQLGQVTTTGGKHVCNIPGKKISCHFGGTLCNGVGNAIDYGGPGGAGGGVEYQKLVDAAKGCGAYIARCENGKGQTRDCSSTDVDHIHITVSDGCGCK